MKKMMLLFLLVCGLAAQAQNPIYEIEYKEGTAGIHRTDAGGDDSCWYMVGNGYGTAWNLSMNDEFHSMFTFGLRQGNGNGIYENVQSLFDHVGRADFVVSGWVDYLSRGRDTSISLASGETKKICVITPTSGSYQALNPGFWGSDEVVDVDVADINPLHCDQYIVFSGHVASVMPLIDKVSVEIIHSPADDPADGAELKVLTDGKGIITLDTNGLVANDGEQLIYKVNLRATNAYGVSTGSIQVTISPYVLEVNLATEGAVPDPGGTATLEVNVENNTASLGGDIKKLRIPVTSTNSVITGTANDDGAIYQFKNWKSVSYENPDYLINTKMSELSSGLTGGSVVKLTGTFEVLNSKIFTGTNDGPGVVSPKTKAVVDGGTVSFRATALCSTITSASYTPEGAAEVSLDVSGFKGDLYATKMWTIPINGNTAATVIFKQKGLSDSDYEDAKDKASGGGSPGDLPTPGQLSDAQLQELTKLIQDRTLLEPGVWDTALDLYQDEITDRVGQINTVLDTPDLDDLTKTTFTDLKTEYSTLGTSTAKTTTPTTTTTTAADGTTTTAVETTGQESISPAESQNPAWAAVGTGGLMLLGQEKALYKPYWSTQRPDVPGEKK